MQAKSYGLPVLQKGAEDWLVAAIVVAVVVVSRTAKHLDPRYLDDSNSTAAAFAPEYSFADALS